MMLVQTDSKNTSRYTICQQFHVELARFQLETSRKMSNFNSSVNVGPRAPLSFAVNALKISPRRR